MSQLVTLFLSFFVLICLFEARTECIRRRWKACEVSYPAMITSYHGGNTSLSNFPFRTPFRTPRCLGWGERISKGSGFCIYALLLFCASPFCDVQWLAGSPFYESCYTLQLTFSKFGPVFVTKLFVVLPNLWFEKLKLCPVLLMLDWFHA